MKLLKKWPDRRYQRYFQNAPPGYSDRCHPAKWNKKWDAAFARAARVFFASHRTLSRSLAIGAELNGKKLWALLVSQLNESKNAREGWTKEAEWKPMEDQMKLWSNSCADCAGRDEQPWLKALSEHSPQLGVRSREGEGITVSIRTIMSWCQEREHGGGNSWELPVKKPSIPPLKTLLLTLQKEALF